MDVLDKVKAAAGQATTRAQEGMATVQTRRKLSQAQSELGQTTYELVQSGELTHALGDERVLPPAAPQAKRVLRPQLPYCSMAASLAARNCRLNSTCRL